MINLYEQYLAGEVSLTDLTTEEILVEGKIIDGIKDAVTKAGGKVKALFTKHPKIFVSTILFTALIAYKVLNPSDASKILSKMDKGIVPRKQDIDKLQKHLEKHEYSEKELTQVITGLYNNADRIESFDNQQYVKNVATFMEEDPKTAFQILRKGLASGTNKDYFERTAGTFDQYRHARDVTSGKGPIEWELQQVLKKKPAYLTFDKENFVKLILYAKQNKLSYGKDKDGSMVIAKDKKALNRVLNAQSHRDMGLALGYKDLWKKKND